MRRFGAGIQPTDVRSLAKTGPSVELHDKEAKRTRTDGLLSISDENRVTAACHLAPLEIVRADCRTAYDRIADDIYVSRHEWMEVAS